MSEPNGIVGVSQVEVEGNTPHDDQPEIYLGKNVLILFRKTDVHHQKQMITITIILIKSIVKNHDHQ